MLKVSDWANSLYLERYSHTNGRVVIETSTFELEIDPEPAWTMAAEDEQAQHLLPQSAAEAAADAESEWMNRLLDRVSESE